MPEWQTWDTWIVIVAAVAAMSCCVPGTWLVLRRQSLMGDALSHTALPGVVLAFLSVRLAEQAGWLRGESLSLLEPTLLAVGAMVIGVLTALFTEAVQKLGQVEASAALGVVFTSFFALGLLLVRLYANNVDIDPDCVLFGQLELVIWDVVPVLGLRLPQALLSNGLLLILNLTLTTLLFKELRISTFDPELATTLGIPARAIHYTMMALTAATLVTAFSSVGSILVIGLLIVPAAAASLLTDRLKMLILLSLALAVGSALLGHVLARTLPPLVFGPLGLSTVRDVSTSGMMAVAAGLLFLIALLFSPRHGILGKLLHHLRLSLDIAADDILGTLYRHEEVTRTDPVPEVSLAPMWTWLTPWYLRRRGWAVSTSEGLQLTSTGRSRAERIVRAHRLWESYMQKHFELPDDHLHATAHLVEHFLDEELQQRLFDELDAPANDPHGRTIPQAPPTP
ncbi:MAG: metal ABC transporter permease [Planctomycetaceae bacterium]|nr:metal ABC transporter permease [Planctomycetaceae bacterium]